MNTRLWTRPLACALIFASVALAAGVTPPPVRQAPPAPKGPTPHMPDGTVDLSGVWVLSGSPDLPSDPSYQPAAQKLYAERKASKGKDDPAAFCLPNGLVRVTPYPYKIVQAPKMVVVLSEGNTHSFRRLFLDGRPHPKDVNDDPSYTGDSIGKWEGDTLVIDTVGFNDKTWLDSTGKPHSDALHVVERYRRTDLGHLEVQYTVEDAKAFTKPYSFKRVFTLAPDWDLQEYVCQAILDGIE